MAKLFKSHSGPTIMWRCACAFFKLYNYVSVHKAVTLMYCNSSFSSFVVVLIESTGALPPETLMCEAIKVLIEKCRYFLQEMDDSDEKS